MMKNDKFGDWLINHQMTLCQPKFPTQKVKVQDKTDGDGIWDMGWILDMDDGSQKSRQCSFHSQSQLMSNKQDKIDNTIGIYIDDRRQWSVAANQIL
jgi:hypothetical protein